MTLPLNLVKVSSADAGYLFATEFCWRRVYPTNVIKIPELSRFSLQVQGIPEDDLVKKLVV